MFQKAHSLISYLHQPHVFSNAAKAAAIACRTGPNKEKHGSEELLRSLITNFALKLRVYHARFAARSGHLKTVKKAIQDIIETIHKQFKSLSSENYANMDIDSIINDYSAAQLDISTLAQPGAASATENKISALVLKASLEAWRKNYKRSAKILDECRKESITLNDHLKVVIDRLGEATSSPKLYAERGLTRSQYLNNMACLHARMRRYESAISLFARAVETAKTEERVSESKDDNSARVALEETLLSGDFGIMEQRPSPMANIMLNAGLTYLQSRQPARALQALYQACRVHRHRPRVWLRMAEACIMAHEMKVSPGTGSTHSMPPPCSREDPTSRSAWAPPKVAKSVLGKTGDQTVSDSQYTDGRDDAVGDGDAEVCWAGLGIVSGKAGFGTAQRLMISTKRLDDEEHSMPQFGVDKESTDEDELLIKPSLTLAYAARCLLNALVLLPSPKSLVSVARPLLAENKSDSEGRQSSKDQQQREAQQQRDAGVAVLWSQFRLRQAVLTKLAYVHLCFQDYNAALHYCSQMWALADTIYTCAGDKQADTRKSDPISRTQGLLRDPWRSLAHVYASEALCHLGLHREALHHVSSQNLFAGTMNQHGENATTSTVDNQDSLTIVDVDREQRQVSRPTALCSLYANAAIALTLEGKIQEATQLAGRALSMKPTSSLARALSAYLSLVQGSHGEAAALLNRGLVQSKSTPKTANANPNQPEAGQQSHQPPPPPASQA